MGYLRWITQHCHYPVGNEDLITGCMWSIRVPGRLKCNYLTFISGDLGLYICKMKCTGECNDKHSGKSDYNTVELDGSCLG